MKPKLHAEQWADDLCHDWRTEYADEGLAWAAYKLDAKANGVKRGLSRKRWAALFDVSGQPSAAPAELLPPPQPRPGVRRRVRRRNRLVWVEE